MSVRQITEAAFADYAAQGTLQPKPRWDLKDAAVYPRLCTLSQQLICLNVTALRRTPFDSEHI